MSLLENEGAPVVALGNPWAGMVDVHGDVIGDDRGDCSQLPLFDVARQGAGAQEDGVRREYARPRQARVRRLRRAA